MKRVKYTRRIRRKKLQRTRRHRGGTNSRQTNDFLFQTSYENALREYTASLPDSDNARSSQMKEFQFGVLLTNYVYRLAKWVSENRAGACLTANGEYTRLQLANYEASIKIACIERYIPRDSQEQIKSYIWGRENSICSSIFTYRTNYDLCRLPGPFQMSAIRLDSRFVDGDGVPYPPRLAP